MLLFATTAFNQFSSRSSPTLPRSVAISFLPPRALSPLVIISLCLFMVDNQPPLVGRSPRLNNRLLECFDSSPILLFHFPSFAASSCLCCSCCCCCCCCSSSCRLVLQYLATIDGDFRLKIIIYQVSECILRTKLFDDRGCILVRACERMHLNECMWTNAHERMHVNECTWTNARTSVIVLRCGDISFGDSHLIWRYVGLLGPQQTWWGDSRTSRC